MASLGLNVARDGSTPADLVRSLGATWVRIVALPDADLTPTLGGYRAEGIKTLLVLARESGGDYAELARRYGPLVDAVQVGNEPDLLSPSSWTMTQVELAALGRAVRGVFGPSMPLVCAGLASGHPSWLDGMDLAWADAVACHPYLKDAPNPDDIEDLEDVPALLEGYRRFGKPVLVTEWGWWGDDEARGAEEVADMVAWAGRTDLCEVLFYFCVSDAMVAPFGLLRANGKQKPAAKRFKALAPLAIHSLWPAVQVPAEPKTEPKTEAARDPWRFGSAEQIAAASQCPVEAVRENWPRLNQQLALCGFDDLNSAAAMIGTVAKESASTFQPVREAYWLDEEWRRLSLRYYPYYGRGFIQNTWRDSYAELGPKIAALWGAGSADPTFDLVKYPDNLLDPDMSAAAAAIFFRDKAGGQLARAARAADFPTVRYLVLGGPDADGVSRMVRVANALGTAAPRPTPPPVDDAAELALALRTLRDVTLPALRAQVQEAERIVEQFVGPRA